MNQIVNKGRVREGLFASRDEDGMNGMFLFTINNLPLRVVASNGGGWEHVSITVSTSRMPPSWSVMCQIKELFFGPDAWVMQLHPPKNENISNHDGCLHLWRPTNEAIPIPPKEFVGIPGKTMDSLSKEECVQHWVESNSTSEKQSKQTK